MPQAFLPLSDVVGGCVRATGRVQLAMSLDWRRNVTISITF